MARSKLDKTPADYMAIAVSPVLIMVLVGSLAFFLLEVLYSGQFETRLRWIIFWFVLASVLVARIGIEQGKEYAAAYGLALGIATAFVSARFVDAVFGAWMLLGIIWWCANKLTWDCTLIDDSQDASGQGLLQVAGFDEEATAAVAQGRSADSIDEPAQRKVAWWQRLLLNASKDANRPHSPGLWVVYFSLAALPLFGIGQLFIQREAARQFGFQLLWVYVAAGLGLLLTTSFLGLRRYLRQRRLQMPAAMTGSWIGMGTGLIVAILLVCLLLPRPDGALSAVTERIDSFSREASKFALLRDGAGEGEGDNRGEDDEAEPQGGAGNSQKQADEQQGDDRQAAEAEGEAAAGNTKGQSDSKDKSGGQGDSSGKGQGEKKGEQGKQSSGESQQKGEAGEAEAKQAKEGNGEKRDGGEAEQEANATPPEPPSANPSGSAVDALAKIIKWVIYGLLAVIALYLVIRNWAQISAALAALHKAWAEFWNNLFGGRRKESQAEDEEDSKAAGAPPPPFASFRNPFTSGMADRASLAQLVRYSFDALQAWAIERQVGRRPEQTPMEFAQSLDVLFDEVSREAVPLAKFYAGLAYAEKSPPAECRQTLERLWRKLASA